MKAFGPCTECGTADWECHAMCSHGVGNCCEACRATAGCTHPEPPPIEGKCGDNQCEEGHP